MGIMICWNCERVFDYIKGEKVERIYSSCINCECENIETNKEFKISKNN